MALIWVGAGNAEGNPALQVLARLTARDVPRTDQPETVTVETAGMQVWLAVRR